MSSSDFSKPQVTDTYLNVTAEINAMAGDLAKGLDPATTSATNLPTGALRWNSANGFWEKFTGTTWNALAGLYNIAVAAASKWASAITVAISGDIAGSATMDGSQNVTITATLPNVNANPGTVGSTSSVPVITTNAKGQVTAVGSAAIPPSIPTTAQVTAALNGAALVGPLTLAADPAAALQPATKQYVDAGVASATSAASAASSGVANKVAKAGDTMTGALVGPQFRTSGGSSGSTGFKIADGTDLASVFLNQINTLRGTITYNNPGAGYVNAMASSASNCGGIFGSSASGTRIWESADGKTLCFEAWSASWDCNCNG